MSEFSKYIEEKLHEKGLLGSDLARYCGIDKSHMYKILKGQRLPSSYSTVRSIGEYLRLISDEQKKLKEYYQIALIGQDVYLRRQAVRKFLTEPINPKVSPSRDSILNVSFRNEEGPRQDKLLNSVQEVIHAFAIEFLRESMKGSEAAVYAITNSVDDRIRQVLEFCIYENPKMKIHQILAFSTENSKRTNDRNYNLHLLKSILTLRSATENYRADYVYDVYAGSGSPLIPHSNIVITSEAVILYSYSAAHAVVHYSPEIREQYMNFFHYALQETHPVFNSTDDLRSHIKETNSHYPKDSSIVLTRHPLMNYFMSPDILRRSMTDEPEADEEILEEMNDYNQKGLHALSENGVTLITSDSAIADFMENGEMALLPKDNFRVKEMKDRLELLQKFIVNFPQMDIYLMKDRYNTELNNLVVEITQRHIFLRYSTWDGRHIHFSTKEAGLCESFLDYAKSLTENNDDMYSKEEALAWLNNLLTQYRRKI